jgi:hypothetical protein
MSEKEKIPVDIERVSRIFNKILKVLLKKTSSPTEALLVMKFGTAWLEFQLGVESLDDSPIREFIKANMKKEKGGKP